jgi:hypothetical protein
MWHTVRQASERHSCAAVSHAPIDRSWVLAGDRYQCDGTPAQKGVIDRDATVVHLAGSEYCLDDGEREWPFPLRDICAKFSDPSESPTMKRWKCADVSHSDGGSSPTTGLPWETRDSVPGLKDGIFENGATSRLISAPTESPTRSGLFKSDVLVSVT